MSKPVIEVNGLGKQYRLGQIGTGTISHDLNRWISKVRGKEDQYTEVGRSAVSGQLVWSLSDVSFTVQQGDVLGIVGRNGAGKSTLLKILSRVTSPTTGNVRLRGRVASLLEVGTGFHPELSGRENIFLNGAILGMRRSEIRSKLDEIVSFSGVEQYLDTPVKRYSSGMYVRLAFAVAAHLEPEILIVDEVLAVGDAEFQKKCLGKMKDVSRNEGRTVLFVSHNMLAIKSLCTTGILLEKGKLTADGPIEKILNLYAQKTDLKSAAQVQLNTPDYSLLSVEMSDNGIPGNFNIESQLTFSVRLDFAHDMPAINVNLFFNTPDGIVIFATCSPVQQVQKGLVTFECGIPAHSLNNILYSIDVMIVENGTKATIVAREVLFIEGVEGKREGAWLDSFPGFVRPATYIWNQIRN